MLTITSRTRGSAQTPRRPGAAGTTAVMTFALCVVGAIAAFRASTLTRATAQEAKATLPGDDIIETPTTVWNRGITIEATPSEVWPWLVQMGYGRAGFYVPEWVDRLVWRVPAANSSVLLPGCQHIAVDDIVADGPDFMAYWRVRIVEPAGRLSTGPVDTHGAAHPSTRPTRMP